MKMLNKIMNRLGQNNADVWGYVMLGAHKF